MFEPNRFDGAIRSWGAGTVLLLRPLRDARPRLLIALIGADLIVVLDGGHLEEVGSHRELVARKGRYAELYGIPQTADAES
ncbi:hypothetical protein ACFWIQ_19915 [Kitasatospora sp. NPDC127059]|uniref:hypothetical protein n=1 Tax=unclassified Kitasatospora TaxID=2633591 RepID=UPI0036501938